MGVLQIRTSEAMIRLRSRRGGKNKKTRTCCIVPWNITFSTLSFAMKAAGAMTLVTEGTGVGGLPSLSLLGEMMYDGGGIDEMCRKRAWRAMKRVAGGEFEGCNDIRSRVREGDRDRSFRAGGSSVLRSGESDALGPELPKDETRFAPGHRLVRVALAFWSGGIAFALEWALRGELGPEELGEGAD